MLFHSQQPGRMHSIPQEWVLVRMWGGGDFPELRCECELMHTWGRAMPWINVCVPAEQHTGVQPSIRRHSIWGPWTHEGGALVNEINALTWRVQRPFSLSATANQAETPPGTTCASTLITDFQPPELWAITSVAQPIQSTVFCDISPS